MPVAPQQHEIDAMLEAALQTKMRHGYTATAAVGLMVVGERIGSLGFNFLEGRAVGDVVRNEDGSTFKVLALV